MTATGVEIAFAAMFGLLWGSFLNVCIHRLPRDLSVVWPGSHCIVCGHPIAWYDNVPVLSYTLLAGRCRRCRASISIRYPLIEALTAVLMAAAVWRYGLTAAGLKHAVLYSALLALIFTDLETRILPDEFTLGGAAAGIVLAWWAPAERLPTLFISIASIDRWLGPLDAALSALLAAGMLWAVAALYQRIRRREGMGLGDVKMVAMIGAFLGLPQALLVVFFGCVAGTVAGLAYIRLTRRDARTYELPFGSFLGLAGLVLAILKAA